MLDLHPMLMGFVLALFLILLVLLNSILYRPLLKFLSDRECSIEKDLEAACSLEGNSGELEQKAQVAIDEAKAEATALREKSLEEHKSAAAQKVEAKLNELNASFDSFMGELAEEKKALEAELSGKASDYQAAINSKLSKI